MIVLKSLLYYVLAVPVFIVSLLCELYDAVQLAWLDSFADAHRAVKKMWSRG